MTPTDPVRSTSDTPRRRRAWPRVLLLALGAIVLVPAASYAQGGGSPWENAVTVLMTSFTGPDRARPESGVDRRRRRDVRVRRRRLEAPARRHRVRRRHGDRRRELHGVAVSLRPWPRLACSRSTPRSIGR